MTALAFTLDGRRWAGEADPAMPLADLLGLHVGCGEGVCGSCTVLVDRMPIRACLMLAGQAEGTEVLTIASLPRIEQSPEPTPLQAAFSDHRAFQCGWCLPGMLVGTAAYLRDHPCAGRDDLEQHFVGHLCRCLGGARVVAATLAAREAMP